jgi:GDPmannose 4,6-dehydratase
MKKALICGVTGQDGAYLAKLLLDKGYEVYGGSRDAQMANLDNLIKLEIIKSICLVSINIKDFRSVLQTIIKIKPDEIYNLASQSSVSLSFEQPVETLESISVGTLNILEAIRFSNLGICFYNAGSSECFGDTGVKEADEQTPFRPRSPYGVAKAAAFWQVANYREAYQLHASTGILFNHDSPLRPERFVTKKIVAAACRIANGSTEKLILGNINISRDWGWAPDYVEAMWLMLQQQYADDYVIATGKTYPLKEFIRVVFENLNLNWKNHVEVNQKLFRPTDILSGKANPEKAKEILNWVAKNNMKDVAKYMVEFEQTRNIRK